MNYDELTREELLLFLKEFTQIVEMNGWNSDGIRRLLNVLPNASPVSYLFKHFDKLMAKACPEKLPAYGSFKRIPQ